MTNSTSLMTQHAHLVRILENRFEAHHPRHPKVKWASVLARLNAHPAKIMTLSEMERTGGEPDVVGGPEHDGAYRFFDCVAESPQGRRSLCYDAEALAARKENKPAGSACEIAVSMGASLLTEAQYQELQQFGEFDLKTSSWLATPAEVRKNGGALFGDRRYGRVFTYHNGVQSYYAARGFRVLISI
ncbi:DUF4256 domain-containing protein [Ottowia thiooxydans]|uniref:DUF4256 domain-containing protein n=1 Tax=Ottowia thiooxydans TaxID=219182 RepID=UPI000422FCAF|nr:DUF4256 domain-containing protein [Ottowia thiooxydans]